MRQHIPCLLSDRLVPMIHQDPSNVSIGARYLHERGSDRRTLFHTSQAQKEISERIQKSNRIERGPAALCFPRCIQEYLSNFFSWHPRLRASHAERLWVHLLESFSYRRISWQVFWIGELGRIFSTVIVEHPDTIDAALENRASKAEGRCADPLVSKCRSLAAPKGTANRGLYSV